jgi:hypothetical protein
VGQVITGDSDIGTFGGATVTVTGKGIVQQFVTHRYIYLSVVGGNPVSGNINYIRTLTYPFTVSSDSALVSQVNQVTDTFYVLILGSTPPTVQTDVTITVTQPASGNFSTGTATTTLTVLP